MAGASVGTAPDRVKTRWPESLPGTRHLKNDASATNGSSQWRSWARGGNLVKYMLMIYGDEKALDDIEREQCYVESTELAHDLHSAGQYLAAAPLHPTSRAISVRMRESKRLVTDGPFAETREQLGGYFLVEASDSEEAIDIASRIPMARLGTIEIRPVIEIPGLPKS